MTVKRDPKLVEAQKNDERPGGMRGPFPVPSSATDREVEVTARWVDSDRTHLWWKCSWCGVRHTYARPPGDRLLLTSCGNVVTIVIDERAW